MSNFRHNGYLIHYNHNHDALGRFTSGPGGFANRKDRKIYKKSVKALVEDSNKVFNDRTSNRSMTNREAVKKKAQAALKTDKDYQLAKKEWNKITDRMSAIQKLEDAHLRKKYGGSAMDRYNELQSDKKMIGYAAEYEKLDRKLDKVLPKMHQKRDKVVDQYLSEFSNATLKDLNISDNTRGDVERFIIRNLDTQWYESGPNRSYLSTQMTKDELDYQKRRANTVYK